MVLWISTTNIHRQKNKHSHHPTTPRKGRTHTRSSAHERILLWRRTQPLHIHRSGRLQQKLHGGHHIRPRGRCVCRKQPSRTNIRHGASARHSCKHTGRTTVQNKRIPWTRHSKQLQNITHRQVRRKTRPEK